MQTTALILRPKDAPFIHVLECDGPKGDPTVHTIPGVFQRPLSFEEFCALPEHIKNPRPDDSDRSDFCFAWRIARLLDAAERSGTLPAAHMREIRWRLEMMQPGCLDDGRLS